MQRGQASHAGFANAPVTKSLLLATAAATYVFGMSPRAATTVLLPPFTHLVSAATMTQGGGGGGGGGVGGVLRLALVRLPASQLCFTSSQELLFGVAAIYSLRVIERQFGSRKFAASLLLLSALTLTAQVGLLAAGIGPLAAGPYFFVFGLLPSFIIGVPPSSWMDKAVPYAAALQLALVRGASHMFFLTCNLSVVVFSFLFPTRARLRCS
jgi:hypothetical protein